MDAEPTVLWSPSPKQAALISCPVFEIFFGGARGGGKTDGVLGDFLEHADAYGEHAKGLMVRRTRKELEDTIERSKTLYTPLGWVYHEQQSYWRAPNGGILRFSYLERDSDANQYQGHSYTRVYVEEIGNFPRPAPILKLFACLRSGAGVPPGFRATGNPGGPGHGWVRERYIDPDPRGYRVVIDELSPKGRIFIPSKVDDNPHIDREEYKAQLSMVGGEALVKAWLGGDWNAVEGAFFNFGSQHVLAPFDIPSDWLRFRSADWGFASPTSVGWWAVVGEDYWHGEVLLPKGALVRYRELYATKLMNDDIAAKVVAMDQGDNIRYAVLDRSAFSTQGGPSIAEQINKVLLKHNRTPFKMADNRKEALRGAMSGWSQMRGRLAGVEDRPMIYCFDTCAASIKTIPFLKHHEDKPEDIADQQEDHAADEWRYACMSRPWVPVPPKPKQIEKRLTYTVDKDGAVRANMSIMDIVQQRIKRKKADGW